MLNLILFIVTVSLLGFGGWSVLYFITETNSKKKFFFRCITFIVLFIIFGISASNLDRLETKANKNVELEIVEISKIYRQNSINTYIVTTKDNNIYTIKSTDVYKGDSNYIVKKHHTNVTDKFKFWDDIDEYTYSIVVTDTNIQTLPNLTN